jgi:hypothetical protein
MGGAFARLLRPVVLSQTFTNLTCILVVLNTSIEMYLVFMTDYKPGTIANDIKGANNNTLLNDIKGVGSTMTHPQELLVDEKQLRQSYALLMRLLCAWFVFEMVIVTLAVGVKVGGLLIEVVLWIQWMSR